MPKPATGIADLPDDIFTDPGSASRAKNVETRAGGALPDPDRMDVPTSVKLPAYVLRQLKDKANEDVENPMRLQLLRALKTAGYHVEEEDIEYRRQGPIKRVHTTKLR